MLACAYYVIYLLRDPAGSSRARARPRRALLSLCGARSLRRSTRTPRARAHRYVLVSVASSGCISILTAPRLRLRCSSSVYARAELVSRRREDDGRCIFQRTVLGATFVCVCTVHTWMKNRRRTEYGTIVPPPDALRRAIFSSECVACQSHTRRNGAQRSATHTQHPHINSETMSCARASQAQVEIDLYTHARTRAAHNFANNGQFTGARTYAARGEISTIYTLGAIAVSLRAERHRKICPLCRWMWLNINVYVLGMVKIELPHYDRDVAVI